MTFDAYLILFTTLILLAYKPGAGFFLNVSYGVKEGFWASFIFITGAAVVCGIYFIVSIQTVILGTLIFDSFIIMAKGVGAMFMIYMGFKTLQEKRSQAQLQQVRTKKLHEYFMTGIFFEMANPITIIFFISLIPPLVPKENLDIETSVFLSLFVFVSMLINYGSISLISSIAGKKFVKQERFFTYLHYGSGLGLVLIGLYIAGSALTYLFK